MYEFRLRSDVVDEFILNKKVTEIAGLKVESLYLSAPIIIASPNPAQAFHKGIGEIRLSLQKFAKEVKKEGIK